jgi:hypothetical protein
MLNIKKLHVVRETLSADSGLVSNHGHETLSHASSQHEMIYIIVKNRRNLGLVNTSNPHSLTGPDPYSCILHRKGIKYRRRGEEKQDLKGKQSM